MIAAYVYIVRCSDGRYYVGSTRGTLERRVEEHNDGTYGGFTARRRTVSLLYAEAFETITDAIAAERQIKRWSRAQKEALIRVDFIALRRALAQGAPWTEDLVESLIPRAGA